MKVNDWLKSSETELAKAGIGTARLDAQVLLVDATNKDKAWLLAHPEYNVTGPTYHKLAKQIKRRINHEPLAYIRGKTEFYGREFIINSDVLEPRPESETMIDLAKKLVTSSGQIAPPAGGLQFLDVGTGSGALGITIKLELPYASVYATDIDSRCLKVARQNTKKHNVDIKFYRGNLLDPLPASAYKLPTIIMSNLPYIPNDYKLNDAAMNEPKIAIFGGHDGLDLYRQLFSQIAENLQFIEAVLTESLPFQHDALAKIAQTAGYRLAETDDFIQLFKKDR